jgi:tetratricopeptide (TPR) repeat protein
MPDDPEKQGKDKTTGFSKLTELVKNVQGLLTAIAAVAVSLAAFGTWEFILLGVALYAYLVYSYIKNRRTQPERAKRLLTALKIVPLVVAVSFGAWKGYSCIPSDKVIVLVADFPGPEPQKYNVTANLVEQLRKATDPYERVVIEPIKDSISFRDGPGKARALGRLHKARMVLWGWYGATAGEAATAQLSVHFEMLFEPKQVPAGVQVGSADTLLTASVSELDRFELQTRMGEQMSCLVMLAAFLALYEKGDTAEANRCLNSSEAYCQREENAAALAVQYLYAGNAALLNPAVPTQQALSYYDKALEINPNIPEALNNRGAVLSMQGQNDAALADIGRALTLKGDLASAWNNQGVVLEKLDQPATAMASYDSALVRDSMSSSAWNNRSVALDRIGRYEDANKARAKAVEYAPQKEVQQRQFRRPPP